MGLKTRLQIKSRQKVKRHKKRLKLQAKGFNPSDYFHGSFFVGLSKGK